MKPGRELDALIAEKVMGDLIWSAQVCPPDPIDDWDRAKGIQKNFKTKNDAIDWVGLQKFPKNIPDWANPRIWINTSLPLYSTDIAMAWKIVEKISGECVIEEFKGIWRCSFNRTMEWECSDIAPHAICLAALKIVKAIK